MQRTKHLVKADHVVVTVPGNWGLVGTSHNS